MKLKDVENNVVTLSEASPRPVITPIASLAVIPSVANLHNS